MLGLSIPSYLGYFLCLIAIFSILGRLFPVLRYVRVLLTNKPLKGRYGLSSWAIVTGAASELGTEFCTQLARDGYNIVLIARREPEMRQTAVSIEERWGIKTKVVVWSAADHGENLEAYYSALFAQIEDLDVAILVNLLSITEDGLYSKQPVELLVKTLDLNVWPSLLLSRWAIGKMSKRKNRSAIINFSSMAAMYPYAGMSLHSATMKFIDFLSQSLHNELLLFPDIPLDLLIVQPSGIQSRTSVHAPNQVPPSLCVSAALKNLGSSPYTAGAFKHSFLKAFTSFIPESFKASLIVQHLKKSRVAVTKPSSS